MTPNFKLYEPLSIQFDASAGRDKFMQHISDCLATEYGVRPSKTGKKVLFAAFDLAKEHKAKKFCLGPDALKKLVEKCSRPVKALN